MIARLGWVLYWGCNGIAAIIAAFAIYEYATASITSSSTMEMAGIRAALVIVVALIGRAILYVFSNE